MPWTIAALTIIAAYLIGAIPFGYLVARARGVDIFEHGSGNIGATNVGRVLGKPFGFLVFLLDFAKGVVPVAFVLAVKPYYNDPLWTRGYVEVAAGLTAFLGHLFPIYLQFRGGKGVATGLGAVLILLPIPTIAAFAVWTVILSASRLMSLASIVAVLVLAAAHLRRPEAWDWTEPRTWFVLIAGILVVVKHRANIKRLLTGTENKLEDTFIMRQLTKSLHVLALGLWFGSAIFFTFIAAPSLFSTFEELGQQHVRENWFPQPGLYRDVKDENSNINAAKEQGTRAAGYAVGPLLIWYFALQGACGFIALATALAWLKEGAPSVHRWRVNVLFVAVLLVLVGWPLERHVSQLRIPRNQATENYLLQRNDDNRAAMEEARSAFGRWHLVSLFINFATILCVTAAMAMAGNLGNGTTGNTGSTGETQKSVPATSGSATGIKEGAPPV